MLEVLRNYRSRSLIITLFLPLGVVMSCQTDRHILSILNPRSTGHLHSLDIACGRVILLAQECPRSSAAKSLGAHHFPGLALRCPCSKSGSLFHRKSLSKKNHLEIIFLWKASST